MNLQPLLNNFFAVTGLPEDAMFERLKKSYGDKATVLFWSIKSLPFTIHNLQFKVLPEGNWSIIGWSNELSEDWWSEIVEVAIHIENYEHMVKDGWWNYLKIEGQDHGKAFDTAIESGHSLLTSLSLPERVLIIKKEV